MAYVAFCTAPFTGHVNPSLAVVSELARRGHRVSYATTAQFSAAVQAAGARAVLYETTLRPPPGGQAAPPVTAARPGGDDFARAQRAQLRELEAIAPVLIRAFGDEPPDVVVCDPMSWVGRVLAARWRVPAVTAVTSMITSARWSLGPAGAGFNPAHPELPRLFAATSAALARYGTGLTADQLLATENGIPVIAYFPRAFQARGDQFGSRVCFAGPCLPSRPGPPAAARPRPAAGDGPVVLLSLGTVVNRQPALFRRCLEALAGTDCRVVAALGGLDAATLGPLPANARAHTYLPLMEVMPGAGVFIGHGGLTSIMEALSCGVPIVALPQTAEQQLNADRLAALGLGAGLAPGRQTQEAMRAAVTTLLRDTSAAPGLAWMRAEIGRAPGAPAAAGVIEDALRGSRVAASAGTGAHE